MWERICAFTVCRTMHPPYAHTHVQTDKIAIHSTKGGLAHARPKYPNIVMHILVVSIKTMDVAPLWLESGDVQQ